MTKGYSAVIDDIDSDLASLKWTTNVCGYAYRRRPAHDRRLGMPANVLMHRVIAERMYGNIPSGMVVDHIDHDRRNNQRTNLQLLTVKQNQTKQKRIRACPHCGLPLTTRY